MSRSTTIRTTVLRTLAGGVAAAGLLFVEAGMASASVTASGAGVSVELTGGPDGEKDGELDPVTDPLDPIIEPTPLGDMWD